MEADWSVELASGDPLIVVPWSEVGSEYSDEPNLPFSDLRFVDLHREPTNINIGLIAEARVEPALRAALLALNAPISPWWTAKCGLWDSSSSPDDEDIDPYELDAVPQDAIFASGCYIDLIPSDPAAAGTFPAIEGRARSLAHRLRSVALRCARVDFVVRRSEINGATGFAITWFVETCGATPDRAQLRRAEALTCALPLVLDVAAITSAAFPQGRYNDKGVGE